MKKNSKCVFKFSHAVCSGDRQHRSLDVSQGRRGLVRQLCLPAAHSRAVWSHVGAEEQCCSVNGLTTSYCPPASDNPSVILAKGRKAISGYVVLGFVSPLSLDNLLTQKVCWEKNDLSHSRLCG